MIANPAFVVYSSVVSFYAPFIVTLLVYIKIYVVLRRRRKRVNTKRSSRAFRADLKAPLKVPRSPSPPGPPPHVPGGWPVLSWGLGTRGWRGSRHLGRAESKGWDLRGATAATPGAGGGAEPPGRSLCLEISV